MEQSLILGIVGLILGVGFGWLLGRLKMSAVLQQQEAASLNAQQLLQQNLALAEQQATQAQDEAEHLKQQLEALQVEHQAQAQAVAKLEERATQLQQQEAQQKETYQQQIESLKQQQQQQVEKHEALQAEKAQLALDKKALETEMSALESRLQAQMAQFEEQKVALKTEFENLANQIFEQKGQNFKQLNQESLKQLLSPLQQDMTQFKQRMEQLYGQESEQRIQLKTELVHLQKLNQEITEQAEALTKALQGQKKTQGNWGELMLENVLESSGLRKGQDYEREVSFTGIEGRQRPDAIVYLPQNKHIIIDAKTSLQAYTRYVNAETEAEAQQALAEHVKAVSDRIEELSNRDYYQIEGLNSPEVVVMFMPIESAYIEALKVQPDLYQKAIEKQVLVTTPTTLLTSLNMVRQLWKFEEQNKHTAALAKSAGKVYNKLRLFLESMDGVGRSLDKAKDTYQKAYERLYSGKGSLITLASEFEQLGVSVKEKLPEAIVEKARLELSQDEKQTD